MRAHPYWTQLAHYKSADTIMLRNTLQLLWAEVFDWQHQGTEVNVSCEGCTLSSMVRKNQKHNFTLQDIPIVFFFVYICMSSYN